MKAGLGRHAAARLVHSAGEVVILDGKRPREKCFEDKLF